MFVTFAGKALNTSGQLLNWLIALMLIVALALSALNAIMGCARSLHQMSVDGQFPRWFQKDQQARRAGPRDGLQRGLLAGRRAAGRRSRDLHVLERRLHRLVPIGARGLLPAAPLPAERQAAGAAAGVHEVRRARHCGALLRHLALRRHQLRPNRHHEDLLLPRLGDGARPTFPFYLYRTRIEDKRDQAPEQKLDIPPGVVASE